jgi:glucokinase
MPSRARRSEPVVIGVDIGATKVAAAQVSASGELVQHSGRVIHRNDGAEGVLRTVVESIHACQDLARGPVAAIGIGIAGQVEAGSGKIHYSPNLRWRNFPLGDRIRAEFEAPVAVMNDARAAAFGEWQCGAGVGERNLFVLIVGTGIGGAVVVDGTLLVGATNTLGEVGHITLVSGGRPCHCPNHGCFEAYAGGWAVGEIARERAAADPVAARALIERAGRLERLDAQIVTQASREGDPFAEGLVREALDHLASGAVAVVNAFNPGVLVLGGGMVEGIPRSIAVVQAAIRERCQPAAAGAKVVPAQLGDRAPLIGAAAVARESLR